jgi:hypothetical protein
MLTKCLSRLTLWSMRARVLTTGRCRNKPFRYTANFFVDQTRQSTHNYPEDELMATVIYNFKPEYTYITGSNFEQAYVWSWE